MRRPVTVQFQPSAAMKREVAVPSCRKGGIPGAARRLAAGEITKEQYVRETQKDYDSLARRLAGFWLLPRSVEHLDIVQELYAATFDWVRRWDPRLAPIGRFLVFNSMADTKKWLNRQRGAKKGGDPSMFEELIDDKFRREDGTSVDPGELLPSAAVQEAMPQLRELLAGVDFEEEGDAECLLALLFEDDEQDAVETIVENGLAPTRGKARVRIERARARAASIYAQ